MDGELGNPVLVMLCQAVGSRERLISGATIRRPARYLRR